MRMQKKSGFTLIELLVVIGIIALMSVIVLTSLRASRDKAIQSKANSSVRNFELAIALYYDDKGTWPSKAGDGRMVITNKTGQGWPQFYALIQPYLRGAKPDASYQEAGGFVTQGFEYFKGTNANPIQWGMYNGATNQYIGCHRLYEGYYIASVVPGGQSKFTLDDGGLDPDYIDHYEGRVTVDPSIPLASCPSTAIIF